MQFFFQILAVVAVATRANAALRNGVVLSETFGGPHGDQYSDLDNVAPGQKVTSLTLHSADRVDGVGLTGTSADGASFDFIHGGDNGDKNTLTLGAGEYITCMEAHWEEQHSHTRIFYLNFTTNNGNTISGGTKTSHSGNDCAPQGYQLGGFFGYAGQELDSIGAIWTSLYPMDDDE
ncbi:unnamed protein product [Phytophthora lilii]|uniref:Unnamed protein product n=1 Tax=Phytophthora lilii TaxID=2077276 RepID=A0A9W6X781_9STRA|nr:unnamed protein product [Phytophthora lilii]